MKRNKNIKNLIDRGYRIITESCKCIYSENEVRNIMEHQKISRKEAEKLGVKFKEQRRLTWLEKVITPLARKHDVTEKQLISILFMDNTPGITTKEAYWAEANDFALQTLELE